MAIPIYVPEEYGPAPSQSQSQGPAISISATSSSVSVPSASPFLHQLVQELYTVYLDYCTGVVPTTSEFQHVTDQNNNIMTMPADGITADRQQDGTQRTCGFQAGPRSQFGQQTQNFARDHEEQALRRFQLRSDRSSTIESSTATPESENNVKSVPPAEDNYINIGRQLRQIADSYQDRVFKSSTPDTNSSTNTKQTEGSEHRDQITISSLLCHNSACPWDWTWTWSWTTTIPMLITVAAASTLIAVRAVATRL